MRHPESSLCRIPNRSLGQCTRSTRLLETLESRRHRLGKTPLYVPTIGLDRLYMHRLMELLQVLMAVPIEPWTQPVPREFKDEIAVEEMAAELPAVELRLATREHGQVLEAAQLLMTYPMWLLIMVGHIWLLSARHGVIPVMCLPGE